MSLMKNLKINCFDGYPRNLSQAKNLDILLKNIEIKRIDIVFNYLLAKSI